MLKNTIKKELLIAAVFTVLSLGTGYITGFWSLGLLLGALIYVIWKWVEFHHFYKWYMSGANIENEPLLSGAWKSLSARVVHNKINFNKKINKYENRLQQYNLTAQALPYAAVILNNSLQIKWANQQALKMLGVSWQEHHNQKIDELFQQDEFISWLHSQINDETLFENPLDTDKKISLKRIKLSDKRYLLVARDVTEQESLRKSRKAFVDNASHELRTPLTVITGYLEMLMSADDISPSWKVALSNAKGQADRMEKIIFDMLKLSTMEHERFLERSESEINMPELLNSIFNDIKNSSDARNYILRANIDSSLNIYGDSEEIFSLCTNLLKNAIIHNEEKTEIELKWFKQGECAQLWICDNGKGIDDKHLPHLTERFYRVDSSKDKNANSTGLGLAIVRQICQNHEATLTIDSKKGQGSQFKITFPRIRIVV